MRLPDTSERRDFPVGYPSTVAALGRMAELVRQDYVSPRIMARARQLLVGLAPGDFVGRVRPVWQWVLDHVTYLPNPVGTQRLTSPDELDRQIEEGTAAECCASMVMYAAAILAAAGIPSLFAAQGWNANEPDYYRHVSLVVVDPRTQRTLWFDPVAALEFPGSIDLGDTLHRPGQPLELWDLDGRKVENMRGLGDCNSCSLARCQNPSLGAVAFGDIDVGAYVDTGADIAEWIAKQFGGTGAEVANAVESGKKAFDAATHRNVTVNPPPLKKPLAPAARKMLAQETSSSALPVIATAAAGAGLLWLFA